MVHQAQKISFLKFYYNLKMMLLNHCYLLLTFIWILSPQTTNGQTTTQAVRYWSYKVQALVTLEYTLAHSNSSLITTDIETDGLTIIDTQATMDDTKLEEEKDYKAYVKDFIFENNSSIALTFEVWTDNLKFFNKMKEYFKSDAFLDALSDQMEATNSDLSIDEIEGEITDTHGDEEEKWYDKWLDFASYSYTQWLVVGGIMLAIFIGCFCLIYCCICKASDHTDPYKNVDLQMVGSRSPLPDMNSSHSVDRAKSHSDVNWVEC
eukprot:405214_1